MRVFFQVDALVLVVIGKTASSHLDTDVVSDLGRGVKGEARVVVGKVMMATGRHGRKKYWSVFVESQVAQGHQRKIIIQATKLTVHRPKHVVVVAPGAVMAGVSPQ